MKQLEAIEIEKLVITSDFEVFHNVSILKKGDESHFVYMLVSTLHT